jgi:hypothetical protein
MIIIHYKVVVQVNLMLNFQVQQQLKKQQQQTAHQFLKVKRMLDSFNPLVVNPIVLQVDPIPLVLI